MPCSATVERLLGWVARLYLRRYAVLSSFLGVLDDHQLLHVTEAEAAAGTVVHCCHLFHLDGVQGHPVFIAFQVTKDEGVDGSLGLVDDHLSPSGAGLSGVVLVLGCWFAISVFAV